MDSELGATEKGKPIESWGRKASDLRVVATIAESRIAGLPKSSQVGSSGEPPTLRQLAARQLPADLRARPSAAMNLAVADSLRRDPWAR